MFVMFVGLFVVATGCRARFGLVGGLVAPTIGVAFAVGRSHQVSEGGRELGGAFGSALFRKRIERPVGDYVIFLYETIEIGDADCGVDPEKALHEASVDDVTEPLTTQPVHDLQNLASPIHRSESRRLRSGDRVTVGLSHALRR